MLLVLFLSPAQPSWSWEFTWEVARSCCSRRESSTQFREMRPKFGVYTRTPSRFFWHFHSFACFHYDCRGVPAFIFWLNLACWLILLKMAKIMCFFLLAQRSPSLYFLAKFSLLAIFFQNDWQYCYFFTFPVSRSRKHFLKNRQISLLGSSSM
jgi:hypothetical protein